MAVYRLGELPSRRKMGFQPVGFTTGPSYGMYPQTGDE